MSRVIHTGDTHVGYRQYHSPERRADFIAAFQQVIEDAIETNVDAVVHAGDLFHDRRPDLQALLGTLQLLRRLDDAEIPFLAVVGNHEATRDAQWLDLFESLGLATRLGPEPVVVGDTAFYGLDFVPRSQRDAIEFDFAPHEADHAALVAHGLFEPFDHGEWDTEEMLAASSVSFDAVLLGDNHQAGTAEVGETWVTYCGSTERTSADERAERGYNIVTFDEDVRIARRGLNTRPFVFVEIELETGEGIERVRERVGQHDLTDAVVVVTIEGDGEPFPPAGIEEYLDDQGALVGRVTDRREIEPADDREVTFADPDEAVRQRIRELGLSDVARGVDETVRASDVADTNVRETVRSHVETRLDDPAAFTPALDDDEASSADESGDGDVASNQPQHPDTETREQATCGDHQSTGDSSDDPGDEPIEVATDGETAARDGQASMEEYL